MRDKLVITANFTVDIATPGTNPDGTPRAAAKKQYARGMVIDAGDLPDGHTAQAWIDKELAEWPKARFAADIAAPAA